MKNEVTTQQYPYGHERIPLITSRGRVIPFFFTKQDGWKRRGEGLREALQL